MLDVALIPRRNIHQRSTVSAPVLNEHIAIVIDIFRASTTICTAIASGAACVVPVRTVAEARRIGRATHNSFIGGERRSLPPKGFDAGNSPYDYSPDNVAGKTVVFTTTNGTAALLSAPKHATRIIGCFANAKAICNFVAVRNPAAVTIFCAGIYGAFSLEDALCAGMFAEKLSSLFALTDEARAAAAMYTAYRADLDGILQTTQHAKALRSLGVTRDIKLCSTPDTLNVVPVFDGKIITAH